MKDIYKGDLVDEYMQGSVKVRIFDGGYKNITQEEVDNILEDISKLVINYTNRT